MRYLLAIIFTCCFSIASQSQMEILDNARFFSIENPAFAVSIFDYNRLNASWQNPEQILVNGQYNINSIYSGFGGFLKRESSEQFKMGAYGSYHTLITKRNIHLMGGASGQADVSANASYFQYKIGMLLHSQNSAKDWFFGSSYSRGDLSTAHYISLQTGAGLLRLTRNSVLRGYAIWRQYFNELNTSEGVVMPTLAVPYSSFGVGWMHTSLKSHFLIGRITGFYQRFGLSCSYAYPLQDYSKDVFEITLQYKLK